MDQRDQCRGQPRDKGSELETRWTRMPEENVNLLDEVAPSLWSD